MSYSQKVAAGLRQVSRTLEPSVRLRLTVPFLVITIIVASLGIYIVTRLVAGNIEERLTNQLADSAQTATNAIIDIERQQLNRLRLMVNTIGIDTAIVEANTTQIDALLRPLAISEGVERLLVVNNQRSVIYRLDQTEDDSIESIRLDDWESVTRVLQNQTDALGDKFVELDQTGETAFFYTASPVLDANSTVVGAVIIGVSMNSVVRILSNQAIAQIIMYESSGNILASTFPVDAVTPLREADVNRYIERGEQTTVVDEVTINESSYQVLHVPFRLRDEVVGVNMIALPRDFVSNRIGVSRNILGGFFVLFFLAVMAIGWGVSRSILIPLSKLVFTTRQIRSGDLNQRVELQNRDELGELGQSFDSMTDALVARNHRIQALYEAQLQETARREAILTSIADAVIVINPDRSLQLTNSAAKSLITLAAKNTEYTARLQQFLDHPEALMENSTLVDFGKYHYSAQARHVSIKDREIGYVIVFRDITELIEVENMKDEIILQISHELRTPLSAATGYLELLGISQQFETNSQQFYHNADKHLKELTYMINQVIEVSAILSNRFELFFHEMDLVELVSKLVEEHQSRFDEKSLVLRVIMPEQLAIVADERRLYQTLEHVLNNARQYTLPQGTVTVKIDDHQNHAEIQVIDTGVGIGKDEIRLVFNRLYRGRAADAGETDSRGLGVGLFIGKEIIQGHRGKIRIKSKLGEGTTVSILLPESPDRSL